MNVTGVNALIGPSFMQHCAVFDGPIRGSAPAVLFPFPFSDCMVPHGRKRKFPRSLGRGGRGSPA